MNARRISLLALVLLPFVVGCESGRGGMTAGNILSGVTQGLTGVSLTDVRGAAVDIDEPEEIELGRAVSTALGSRYKLLRDDSLTRYVALVGNAVALQSDRPDIRYYFSVLDTDEANAFAAPGGYIFITRGTLTLIRDEATLAGVLGHEIGHIALHHHGETIKKERRAALLKSGGMFGLRFVPGTAGSAVAMASPALNLMADGLTTAVLKGFDRKEEGQADVVGVQYAGRAGYDPAGLRDFMKATLDRGTQPDVNKIFATHPGIDERLKEQEAQLKTLPAGGRRATSRFEQRAMAALKPGQAVQPAAPGQPTGKPPVQPTR